MRRDYMGRRFEKKVTTSGTVTLRQRYLYRGYLQIAAIDLQRSAQPALWYITWEPSQASASRPLAIQKDGSWYTYGWDLTKDICEVYGPSGFIRTSYTYTPYGTVTADGDVDQPIQWSSEFNDTELALIYYNYRYYNPQDGRWTRRDPIGIEGGWSMYAYVGNFVYGSVDILGKKKCDCWCGKRKMTSESQYCDNNSVKQRKTAKITIYFGHCNGPLSDKLKNNKTSDAIGAVTCYAKITLESNVQDHDRILDIDRPNNCQLLLMKDSLPAAKREYDAAKDRATQYCSEPKYKSVTIAFEYTDSDGEEYLKKTLNQYRNEFKRTNKITCDNSCSFRGGVEK